MIHLTPLMCPCLEVVWLPTLTHPTEVRPLLDSFSPPLIPYLMRRKEHYPMGGKKVSEAQLMRAGGWEERDKLKTGDGANAL
jgi:hypothetical protein